jgi:hypothetical protein
MSGLHVYKQTTYGGITPSTLSPEYGLKKTANPAYMLKMGSSLAVFFSNSAFKSDIRSYLRSGRTCTNPDYDLKKV